MPSLLQDGENGDSSAADDFDGPVAATKRARRAKRRRVPTEKANPQ